MTKIKHLGVLTSGGDAPGMNAAIRAVTRSALDRKLRVTGIERGYQGMLEADFHSLQSRSVGGIINRGGTILRTLRCPAFREKKERERAYANLRDARIDALAVIGGNGSSAAANIIHQETGMPVAVVPASIDNDVPGSDDTVGFDTAVNTAVAAIDKIRDTATSHERIFVIEVMGRENGFIAVEVGLSSGAEAILVPEINHDLKAVANGLISGHKRGKLSSVIVMAEGAGDSRKIAEILARHTRMEIRVSALGYIQRGGAPTAHSRILAARMGSYAVCNLLRGKQAHLAGIQKCELVAVPLAEVAKRKKKLDRATFTLAMQLAQ